MFPRGRVSTDSLSNSFQFLMISTFRKFLLLSYLNPLCYSLSPFSFDLPQKRWEKEVTLLASTSFHIIKDKFLNSKFSLSPFLYHSTSPHSLQSSRRGSHFQSLVHLCRSLRKSLCCLKSSSGLGEKKDWQCLSSHLSLEHS